MDIWIGLLAGIILGFAAARIMRIGIDVEVADVKVRDDEEIVESLRKEADRIERAVAVLEGLQAVVEKVDELEGDIDDLGNMPIDDL